VYQEHKIGSGTRCSACLLGDRNEHLLALFETVGKRLWMRLSVPITNLMQANRSALHINHDLEKGSAGIAPSQSAANTNKIATFVPETWIATVAKGNKRHQADHFAWKEL
jgi:hypothetical protein